MHCETGSERAGGEPLTFGEELLNDLSGLLIHLVERALHPARDTLNLRSMLACARLKETNVLLSDLLDDLNEPSIAADRVAVELLHVRAIARRASAAGSLTCWKVGENPLFDVAQEPPVRQVPDNGQPKDKFASRNESKAEESGTADNLRVVEVSGNRTDQAPL